MSSPTEWYRPSRCNYLFLCRIAANGAFDFGPLDWTVAKTGVGTYVITHNLGTDRYALIPTLTDPDFRSVVTIAARDLNTVTVAAYGNGVLADKPVQVLMMVGSQ